MPAPGRTQRVYGIDFTSAPRASKPIVVASGRSCGDVFDLEAFETLASWHEFEGWLQRPGSWVGGFDFPFGLPREALLDLGWPVNWPALTRHCRSLGRHALRAALDAHRAARPVGRKFCYRRGDAAAFSHSPLKLVNPPVALMFLEGAPRLVEAGVTVPGMLAGDPSRIALEAYPGYAVRSMLGTRGRPSYKNDARAKQTAEQATLRARIVKLLSGRGLQGIRLRGADVLMHALVQDGTGDRLDAVLCALQTAWGWHRRSHNFGLPKAFDPVEGWIVSVPCAADGARERGASGD